MLNARWRMQHDATWMPDAGVWSLGAAYKKLRRGCRLLNAFRQALDAWSTRLIASNSDLDAKCFMQGVSNRIQNVECRMQKAGS